MELIKYNLHAEYAHYFCTVLSEEASMHLVLVFLMQ